MKFIFLIITTISIIGSCLLGILTNSTQNKINEAQEKLTPSTVSSDLNVKGKKELAQNLIDNYEEKKNNFDTIYKTKEDEYKKWEIEYSKKFGMDIYKTNPTAFLTYDDGPNSLTSELLDTLKEKNVKATFFISAINFEGNENRQAILKRTVDEGHVVAIHTYSHNYEKIYSSKTAYFEDFDKAEKLIEEVCGVQMNLVRLPGGTSSAKSMCKKYGKSDTLFSEIMEELDKRGFMVSDWNIDTNDWKSSTTAESITASVSSEAEKRLKYEYKAALILMHNKEKSIKATGPIIDSLKALGYSFEPMTQYGYAFLQAQK